MSFESNPFCTLEDLGPAVLAVIHAEQFSNERRDELYSFADSLKDTPLVVDLSPNTSINSRMIAILITLQKRVKDGGGTIRFCGILPQVRKLLDITRTSPLFTIDQTRKESLAAVGVIDLPQA